MIRTFIVLFACLFLQATLVVAQTKPAMPDDDIHGQFTASSQTDPHAGHNHAPGEQPGETPYVADPVKDDAFADALDIDKMQTLSIQHNQTLKTLDSFARQTLTTITGKRSLDGRPAVFTVLDMAFRPEAYRDRSIVKIKNVPLRSDFQLLDFLSVGEKERIKHDGTISVTFFMDPRVQDMLAQQQSAAVFKMQAIGQLQEAAGTLLMLSGPDLAELHVFAPATNGADDHQWRALPELFGTVPQWASAIKELGQTPPAALPNYESKSESIFHAGRALLLLRDAWRSRDAVEANKQIAMLADSLPMVNAEVYPSAAKRSAEVIYNKLAQLTIPGIMLYFSAMVLFLLSARSGAVRLRLWGLRLMVVALLVHTAGIAIRWWLVEKSVGNWFEAIPIKNMFESVMFSAWFGALIALVLEMRRSRGLFGAAGSFVGTLAMVALLTVPYFIRDIGGEISQSAGVLMSYWLYIHVTMVVASYALITMGFLLSVWWLVEYYRHPESHPRIVSGQAQGLDPVIPGEFAGGALSLGFTRTLASVLLFRKPAVVVERVSGKAADKTGVFLTALDACNLVVLQLAFWILGVGIILGAVWADMSWGRPWAWDPKETFALVTWIVYLIVVHVRVATVHKAWWTATLSIVGFFIMMFNWIGVNFFLVGLHSYA